MKKILYSFLFFSSGILFGQISTKIKFVICNDVIGTVEMFENYKKSIESAVVFKTDAKLPQHLKKFNYLAGEGLKEIKLKNNVGTPDIISLAALNDQSNLPKDTPVIIEGYKFSDTGTNIYSEIIKKIEVRDDNEKYLFISTTDN